MLAAIDITTPITIGLASTLAVAGYIVGRFTHRFEQLEQWQETTVELLTELVRNDREHQQRLETIEDRIGL